MIVWAPWVLYFLVFEFGAILTGKWPTLSQVWVDITRDGPLWLSLFLSAIVGGLLFWLAFGHWLARILDKPGLNPLEFVVIVFGACYGVFWAYLRRRKERESA